MCSSLKGGKIMKKKPSQKTKGIFSKTELDFYKEKLLDLREDMLRQMRETSEDTLMKSQKDISGDISGYSLHIADVATDNYERDFNLGLVSSERKIIMEIEEALKRIEDKTYGVCPICGGAIPKSRLNAIPYAKYNKECQEKLEKEDKI
jgi:RNA polymerase-binding protein DksA